MKRQVNPWLEHYSNALKFMMENKYFKEITFQPSYKLNVIPIKKLSPLSDIIKVSLTLDESEIVIPQIEIPILDETHKKDKEKLQTKHKATFLIGGKIAFKNMKVTNYSYSICITFSTIHNDVEYYCEEIQNINSCCLPNCKSGKRIVRRIHFDYQPENKITPHHFQIGGKFPNDDAYNDIHYCLDHYLERPRIPYPSVDFIYLLDLMLKEFNTPLKNWTKDQEWIDYVEKSKKLLNDKNNFI